MLGAVLLALGQTTMFAQAVVRPAFEVASIKMTPPHKYRQYEMNDDPGRINWANTPLKIIICRAYGIKPFQIAGPDEILSQPVDIVAKLPSGSTPAQIPLMLQSLLAERFGLTLHRDTRTMPVYELLAPKSKFKLEDREKAIPLSSTNGAWGRQLTGRATMKELAKALSGWLDRPMVDKTGIEGVYDIDLKWSGWEYERASMAGAGNAAAFDGIGASFNVDHPTIFSEVRNKLGLRVQSGKAPVEILVIDRIQNVPTEN